MKSAILKRLDNSNKHISKDTIGVLGFIWGGGCFVLFCIAVIRQLIEVPNWTPDSKGSDLRLQSKGTEVGSWNSS